MENLNTQKQTQIVRVRKRLSVKKTPIDFKFLLDRTTSWSLIQHPIFVCPQPYSLLEFQGIKEQMISASSPTPT